MKQEDFFEGMAPKVGEFAKFVKVGDSVQGTYIGRTEGIDGYKNPQYIYNLEDKEGKMWNIGVKKTSVNLIRQMDALPFGYIVGIRLDEIRPSKAQPPLNPTKIINAYYNLNEPTNPKYVNLGWMASHKAAGGSPVATSTNLPPVETSADDDFDTGLEETADEAPGAPDIFGPTIKLAITKGMVDADSSVSDAKAVISAITGIEMTKENLKDIVMAVTKFKK